MLVGMVRVKKNSPLFSEELSPVSIPLKYCEFALIPDELVSQYSPEQPYRLATGEIVVFRYRMTCNNKNGKYTRSLELLSRNTHGMPFSDIQAVWASRIGKLSGWWHRVKLEKR